MKKIFPIPSIVSDMGRYKALNKERAQLAPIVDAYRSFARMKKDLADSEELLKTESDQAMIEMLSEECGSLREQIIKVENDLTVMLLPKDPHSGKDIMMEIRAGTGGEEAALFVADLFRMYTRYADTRGWKYEIMEKSETGIGGYREIVLSISGETAYDDFKYESGKPPRTANSVNRSGRAHSHLSGNCCGNARSRRDGDSD